MSPVLAIAGLSKHYGADSPVFCHVDLHVNAGEFLAITGESGVGKSTLLNCMAGLDEPSSGSVHLIGQDMTRLSDDARAILRRESLGFVFQAFHVLPHLTVAQNVALPLMLLGQSTKAQQRERVLAALTDVGLDGLTERLPAQLSGGQLQRVAIARAVVHRPALILADEPTGNLDPRTAAQVLDVLQAQTRAHGCALVLVTHSSSAAERASRRLELTPTGLREA